MSAENNIEIAENYYKATANKDIDAIEKYIHPNISFSSPFAKLTGKENFIESIKRFIAFFDKLTIRAKFGNATQAMIVYDLDCPEPVGKFSSSALITIQDNLIKNLELFFDTRAME